MILNNKQRELVNSIDCLLCSDRRPCDQVRCECPKVNLYTLEVDDVSILKPKTCLSQNKSKEQDIGFLETTKSDFDRHLYQKPTRCRYKNKILSFYSSEKEGLGLLFFFSHNRRYYKAYRDISLDDTVLDNQMMNCLYPDNKSFRHRGWLCKYNAIEGIFDLYTPTELEQPAGMRYSEMEVATPAQAIEFINSY